MWTTLRVFGRVLLAPLYVLWLGYRGLWWAFDDSDARREAGSAMDAPPESPPPPQIDTDAPRFPPVQSQAFEIVDTTPRPAVPPTGPLRGGFAATMVWTALFGYFCRGWAEAGMSSSRAWILWGWGSTAFAVVSLFIVRHVASREAQVRPQTPWGHLRATVAGLGDAAAAGVAAAGRGVRRAAHGIRAGWLLVCRVSRWSVWSSVRDGAGRIAALVSKPRSVAPGTPVRQDPATAA
jgi:hypothetical protein